MRQGGSFRGRLDFAIRVRYKLTHSRRSARVTPEQQQLVVQHYACAEQLVKRMIRRRRAFLPAAEDMHSAALVGLCEAAKRFDASRGVRFGTYAWWWMKLEAYKAAYSVLMPVGDWRRRPSKARLDRAGADVSEDEVFERLLPYAEQPVNAVLEGLGGLFDYLRKRHSERDLAIYQGVVLEERTLESMGREHGLTRERVRQLVLQLDRSTERFGLEIRNEVARC